MRSVNIWNMTEGDYAMLCITHIAAALMYVVNAYLKTDSIHHFVDHNNITIMLQ
jgi:hypothetical protein